MADKAPEKKETPKKKPVSSAQATNVANFMKNKPPLPTPAENPEDTDDDGE
jgi:hypothetical protein